MCGRKFEARAYDIISYNNFCAPKDIYNQRFYFSIMRLKEFLKSKLGFVILLVLIYFIIKNIAANLFAVYSPQLNFMIIIILTLFGFLFFDYLSFKEKWISWQKGGLIGGSIGSLLTLIFFILNLNCRHEGCIILGFILLYGLISILVLALIGAIIGLIVGKIKSKK